MDPTTLPISLSAEALESLLRGEPFLLGIPDFGQVTLTPPEKKATAQFRSLDELSAEIMKPVEFTTEFKPGVPVKFLIKALDSNLCKQRDDIGADVMPPKKVKPAQGRRSDVMQQEEYDYDDAGYRTKLQHVSQLQQAFILVHGILEFEVPGENLEEKMKALRAKLPPRVLNGLQAAILGLTVDPIKQADFS